MNTSYVSAEVQFRAADLAPADRTLLSRLAKSRAWERGRLNTIYAGGPPIRACDSCFIFPNESSQWLFAWLQRVFSEAAAYFDVTVGKIVEAPQVVRYQATDFFDWHRDAQGQASSRRLSLSIQLTEPFEYRGGLLEFDGGETASTAIGATTIFRSDRRHRVTPVVSGQRTALVAWIDAATPQIN